jgi:hypothetical protein
MSFSVTMIRGTAAEVREALLARAQEQAKIDAQYTYDGADKVAEGHQREFASFQAALESAIAENGEENRTYEISGSGHSGDDGSGQPTINLRWWPTVAATRTDATETKGDGVVTEAATASADATGA